MIIESEPSFSGPGTASLIGVERRADNDNTCTAPVLSFESIPGPMVLQGLGMPSPFENRDPLLNVQKCLRNRTPVPDYSSEIALFNTLPSLIREEVRALQKAFALVRSFVAEGSRVQPACVRAIAAFPHRHFKLKTFRANYDHWVSSQDWVDLVNRSKAGPRWQESNSKGLPAEFLALVKNYFGRFARADGKRQATFAIHRWWRTGKDLNGKAHAIPGYAAQWETRNPELLPVGWHYSNILKQVKGRKVFTKAVRALLHEGTAAAKKHLPHVHNTRADLLFLEEITFDDVKTDFLVFDPETGKHGELWLLVARDTATAMVLGFVPHFSMTRPDGSSSHLGHKEMKQLAAWLLERYPLPPYLSRWVVERGTATLSEGSARAIQEMMPDCIKVSWTSMVGGNSTMGYRESRKGNSNGKASHESHNRLIHTQLCHVPGQTGADYSIQPADLLARTKECVEIWNLREFLPAHLRGQERYSLLTPPQAIAEVTRICIDQNFRTDHRLNDFIKIQEWLGPDGHWLPANTFVFDPAAPEPRMRTRMESPVERAVRLMAPYAGQWKRASLDVIITFLSHNVRTIPQNKINEDSGEIKFRVDDADVIFAPPPQWAESRADVLAGGRTAKCCLGYFAPNDPQFLHVTSGDGSIIGTWYRRQRTSRNDLKAIEEAMRYTANALKAAQEVAARLAAPEREQLAAMRAHNAELALSIVDRGNDFIEVAPSPGGEGRGEGGPVTSIVSPLATVLSTNATATRQQIKAAQNAETELENDAKTLLRRAML